MSEFGLEVNYKLPFLHVRSENMAKVTENVVNLSVFLFCHKNSTSLRMMVIGDNRYQVGCRNIDSCRSFFKLNLSLTFSVPLSLVVCYVFYLCLMFGAPTGRPRDLVVRRPSKSMDLIDLINFPEILPITDPPHPSDCLQGLWTVQWFSFFSFSH